MSESVLTEIANKVYIRVKLRIKFRDRVLAGVPKNDQVLDYFMNARHMSDKDKDDLKARIDAGTLSAEEKDEVKNTSWCQFEKNKAGELVLWHGNVKAMLREIFVTLGLTQKRPNLKKKKGETEEAAALEKGPSAGGKQTLQHAVHVEGLAGALHLPFLVGGSPVKEPSGSLDKVKHITDAAGKRSALGRHDYLDQPELDVILKWPRESVFTEVEFKQALAVCQDDGLGACRSQGFGKFDVIAYEVL